MFHGLSTRRLSIYGASGKTYVYNLTTHLDRSGYLRTTRKPSQYTPLAAITPDHSDTSFGDRMPVNTVVIVTRVLLTIFLTIIFTYPGLTKRMNLDTQSAKSNDPTLSDDTNSQRNWKMAGILGRSHIGSIRAQPPEHPHAPVEDLITNRSVQGAVEVPMTLQHPHVVVEKELSVEFNAKTELEFINDDGCKEELGYKD